MKWLCLFLGLALLLQDVTVIEAKGRDSDGDGTPDTCKSKFQQFFRYTSFERKQS
jgi:hypothetical protein